MRLAAFLLTFLVIALLARYVWQTPSREHVGAGQGDDRGSGGLPD